MRRNNYLKAMLAVVFALGALAPSAATAKPVPADPPCSRCDFSAAALSASSPPTDVRAESHSGFDWGDAGIGAAAGVALTLGVGGTLALSRRHRRGTTGRTAAVGGDPRAA